MRFRRALPPILFILSAHASAQPAGLVRGLDLQVHPLPQVERINGVPVRIVMFSGDGTMPLVLRWQRYWQHDPSTFWMHAQKSGTWHILSRVTPRGLEVLQSRQGATSAEMFWSLLSTAGPTRSRTSQTPRFRGCRPGLVVEGRDPAGPFRQATHLCEGSPHRVQRQYSRVPPHNGGERFLSIVPMKTAPGHDLSAVVTVQTFPESGVR